MCASVPSVPRQKQQISGAQLYAEGIVEIGACEGTNVVYVKTNRRLCLFYADEVASYSPKLSPWALHWARDLLDRGHNAFDVSYRLGLAGGQGALTKQLTAAGLAKPRLATDPRPTNLPIAEKQNRFMRRGRGSKAWVEEWFED